MLVPMCPRCGDTRVLSDRGLTRLRCKRCRHDLYTDRPRSYAEMEGLVPASEGNATIDPQSGQAMGLVRFVRAGLGRLRVKLGIR